MDKKWHNFCILTRLTVDFAIASHNLGLSWPPVVLTGRSAPGKTAISAGAWFRIWKFLAGGSTTQVVPPLRSPPKKYSFPVIISEGASCCCFFQGGVFILLPWSGKSLILKKLHAFRDDFRQWVISWIIPLPCFLFSSWRQKGITYKAKRWYFWSFVVTITRKGDNPSHQFVFVPKDFSQIFEQLICWSKRHLLGDLWSTTRTCHATCTSIYKMGRALPVI